jgi:glutamate dehydrogenase
LDIPATSARFAPGAAALAEASTLLPAGDREAVTRSTEELVAAGVPDALATRVAQLATLLPSLDLVEVATSTGLSFDEVAGVYFAVGDQLELHALRERISALPREERWDALARRALWEDLLDEQRALAADVLRESGNGPIADRVSAWIAHNALPVERCQQVLADVKAGGGTDLATLSVAVREIRNLIDATGAPARDAPEPVEAPVAPVSGSSA